MCISSTARKYAAHHSLPTQTGSKKSVMHATLHKGAYRIVIRHVRRPPDAAASTFREWRCISNVVSFRLNAPVVRCAVRRSRAVSDDDRV